MHEAISYVQECRHLSPGPDEQPRRVPALAKPELALGRFSSVSFDPQSKRTVTIHSDSRGLPRDFCIRVWDNDSGGLLAVMAE